MISPQVIVSDTPVAKGWNLDVLIDITQHVLTQLLAYAAIYHWRVEAIVTIGILATIVNAWATKRSPGKHDQQVTEPITVQQVQQP